MNLLFHQKYYGPHGTTHYPDPYVRSLSPFILHALSILKWSESLHFESLSIPNTQCPNLQNTFKLHSDSDTDNMYSNNHRATIPIHHPIRLIIPIIHRTKIHVLHTTSTTLNELQCTKIKDQNHQN